MNELQNLTKKNNTSNINTNISQKENKEKNKTFNISVKNNIDTYITDNKNIIRIAKLNYNLSR